MIIGFITVSCKTEIEIDSEEEKIEIKEITVNITLPKGSKINPNDLKVSTILTDNAPVINSSSKVSTFDNEAVEMVFAINSQDNMVLIGYFDPQNISDFTINSETTAIALVMMHPWTSNLSVNAKKEAINYIKSLPEFASLKNSVEQSIISGNLDPLSSTTIIDKIVNIQNTHFNKYDIYKTPLQFNIDQSKLKIQNIQSSAAYSVGLYNSSNQLIEYKLVKGLGKTRSILNDLFTNTFLFTPYPATEFNTPANNGTYYLKAKSGLSFDTSKENLQAAYENSKTLLANVIGIFSTTLENLLKNKLGECSQSIGSFVYNGTSTSLKISESLQAYSQGTKSGYLLIKDLISFVSKRYDAVIKVIKNCSSNVYNLKESPLKYIFKYIDIITKLENAFNTGALVTDWLQFDKNIEACFSRNTNGLTSCLEGIWTMDFNLAPPGNNCDEIDLEDEAGIPPTFHFGDNGKIIFDSMSDPDWFPALNNPAEYNNTYTMEENVLKIQTHYFQNQYGESFTNNMTLTYNSTANNFSGKYVYQFFLNGVLQYMCSNTVKIYK